MDNMPQHEGTMQVLSTPELVERILMFAEPAYIIAAERACRMFYEVARTSLRIQQRLGFEPQPKIKGGIVAPYFNEALFWHREGNVVYHSIGRWELELRLKSPRSGSPYNDLYELKITITGRGGRRGQHGRPRMGQVVQDVAPQSLKSMLLLNPPVRTFVQLRLDNLPREGALLHDYRAGDIETYENLVDYLFDFEQTLARPFYEAWFKHWGGRRQRHQPGSIKHAFDAFEGRWIARLEAEGAAGGVQ